MNKARVSSEGAKEISQGELRKEEKELERVEAAIPDAMAGNWRDLRTVFEFAGINPQNQNKDAPS